jgi:hypothetical protein
MEEIITKLREKHDVKAEMHAKKWKLIFTIEREQDDAEKASEMMAEFCKVQVELLKMPGDNEQIAIKFNRLAGSAWYFYE